MPKVFQDWALSTKHFNIPGMECDVLTGERVPSFSSIDQLKNLKVIHVRFMQGSQADEEDNLDLPTLSRLTPRPRRTTMKKCTERKVVADQPDDSYKPSHTTASSTPKGREERPKLCTDVPNNGSQKDQQQLRQKIP